MLLIPIAPCSRKCSQNSCASEMALYYSMKIMNIAELTFPTLALTPIWLVYASWSPELSDL